MKNQTNAIAKLQEFASADFRTILLSGSVGCGKTHLAKHYAKLLGANYVNTAPSVSDIRCAISGCATGSEKIVICIENLDSGVPDASNTVLKFIEEPPDGVYIVITCRDQNLIFDTVKSRCHVIELPRMSKSDITSYANSRSRVRLELLSGFPHLLNAVESTADFDYICTLSIEQINELACLHTQLRSNAPVSNTAWNIQKFRDGTKIQPQLMMRVLLHSESDANVKRMCLNALRDMNSPVPDHVVIMNFVMCMKYGI